MTAETGNQLERWPGYDRQTWAERFEHLDGQYADILTKSTKRIIDLTRTATDRRYMMEAMVQMLGPKGKQVVALWEAKGVKRIHSSWAEGYERLTGEEVAQVHLDLEEAMATAVPLESLDEGLSQVKISDITGATDHAR